MAEYTAFVEAGNGLVELLRENMTPEPISKRDLISLCSPHESENNQVTVYLFHIEEDKQSAPSGGYMQQSRNLQRMAPSRFQLSFLITAHSKAPAQLREADQYRMLGAAIQVLKDHPVLDRKYLQGSLLETGASVHISVERPNFDQMIKIWNDTTKPYKLSIVCKLEGIFIDSKRTRSVARVGEVAISLDEQATTRKGGNV